MIYAGIGSRQTPSNILTCMEILGFMFAHAGHTLRSGGAMGADRAFEIGHIRRMGRFNLEIFTPSGLHLDWLDHAKQFHPAWNKCSSYAQALHGRNSAIMLGAKLDKPVDCVLCWTANGKAIGGSGQALRIAEHHKIPVFNMFDPFWLHNLNAWQMVKNHV